jgi:hypothetical protein
MKAAVGAHAIVLKWFGGGKVGAAIEATLHLGKDLSLYFFYLVPTDKPFKKASHHFS